jgi:hypothetical protein
MKTALQAATSLLMQAVVPEYVNLRTQLYSLHCRQKKADKADKIMFAFYTKEILSVERKIFALQEKTGY